MFKKKFSSPRGDVCFGYMLPHCWLTNTFKATHPKHIATLKSIYGTTKKLWVHVDDETKDVEEYVPPSLDIRNLELQSSFF